MAAVLQKKRMEKLSVIIYYIAFAIELAIVIIDKSAYINPIEGQLFRVTFLLFALKIVMTEYSAKEWLTIGAFGILGAVSYFATGRNEIIRIVVFVAATKNISLNHILKFTFYTILSGTVLLILLSLLGVMGDISITTTYRADILETRYTLGLGHPNALHCMVWSIVILGIYLYFDRLKWYAYLILFAGNIGLYLLTDSKAGVAITVFTILAATILFAVPKAKENKWIYILGALAVLGCFFISLVASKYGYTDGPLMRFDRFFTGRIRWSYFYGGLPKWSLFSNPENIVYFDMGFMRLFYWYGYIPGIVYIIVHLLFVWDCFKRKDSMALLVIVMFTIYTVMEAHAVSVYIMRNYVLLLLAGHWSTIFMASGTHERYLFKIFSKEGKSLESN